jgi:hypothetical protein
MARYMEQVQDENETADQQLLAEIADANWRESIESMERTNYGSAVEKELALAEGYDPWGGESLSDFFSRINDEAIDAEIPSLEEIEAR